LLEKINSPADLKKVSLDQLPDLCEEIRQFLIDVLSKRGGHVGPNLGIVEATAALHWVFDSPQDKIIFDVSHQCYTHKILTGRKEALKDLHITRQINGYTDFSESEHDHFRMGHTSTSLSLASGLAKARDLKGEKYNVISLIGDGALSGGEAFEGLNIAANLNSNFIIIVNDNDFSIDENSGGLYANLAHLRETNGEYSNNYFKALGYEYFYIDKGNSVIDLVEVFTRVKDSTRPVIIHIKTKKGQGLPFAEKDPVHWHYSAPFDKKTGQIIQAKSQIKSDDLVDKPLKYISTAKITNEFLDEEFSINDQSCLLIPGAPALGDYLKNKYPEQYIDTGIAEEQAVAMMSGLAKNGAKPYLYVNSPFVQRTYDQTIIDWVLNEAPGVMLVAWSGISGGDYTHVGMYDIAMLSNVANLIYIAPASADEYKEMLQWSKFFDRPLAIRLGSGNLPENYLEYDAQTDYLGQKKSIELGEWVVTKKGLEIAIIALGEYYAKGLELAKLLISQGKNPTIVNPRFVNVLDKKLLKDLSDNHKLIITLENGIVDGGFGQKIASFYGKINSSMVVKNYGAKREFINNEPISKIMERYHLNPEQILQDIELG
jgi:1-deoxy-D-xylulose-5-phosphate synthase